MRILLVDDHQLMRDGLRHCLEQEMGWEVVAEASEGRSAVEIARQRLPQVAIVDISMPEMNGIEATQRIIDATDGVTRVLVLSMHEEPEFVTEALRAGASGYVLKVSALTELVEAVKAVVSGRTYLSEAISGDVLQGLIHGRPEHERDRLRLLSDREREILQLLAEGHNAKEIGLKLGISAKTVHTFRGRLMDKLDLHTLPALTKFAIRVGLTRL
ncbi:response regulator [Mucisphaera sp.]|uniref:response regulator n=1 Tax=Mucisphaera sp. TaxID=2913024 RepID=UPI003D150670